MNLRIKYGGKQYPSRPRKGVKGGNISSWNKRKNAEKLAALAEMASASMPTIKQEVEDVEEQKMDRDTKQESTVNVATKREEESKTVVVKKEYTIEEEHITENQDILKEENIIKKDNIKKDDTLIKIIPKEAGIAYLTVDNEVVVDDDETITMTAEEMRSYIEKSVFDIIVNNNPMATITKQSKDLHERVKRQKDELEKLTEVLNLLEKEQMKFLRNDTTLRKYLVKTVGVGVDMAILPNSLPKSFPEDSLLKNRLTSANPPKPPVAKKSDKDIECIDLTDDSDVPTPTSTPSAPAMVAKSAFAYLGLVKHPAPLPPKPFVVPNKNLPPIPPKPRLRISAENRGIVLQWDMIPNTPDHKTYAPLLSFDIFGYQEQQNVPINTLLWKKIGSVKSMILPMACTLTQFIEGNKYHFSVRAVDVHNRCGFYSDPISIVYNVSK